MSMFRIYVRVSDVFSFPGFQRVPVSGEVCARERRSGRRSTERKLEHQRARLLLQIQRHSGFLNLVQNLTQIRRRFHVCYYCDECRIHR